MTYELETKLDSPDQNKAVAVIGLGALFPGQPGLAGFWSTIKRGLDTITDIPLDRFNPSDYYDTDPKARDRMYCRRGAFLSPTPFDPLKFGVAPRDLETIDSAQLLGLVVADAALTDAGYPADRSDHSRTAVIMGVTGGLEMLGHMSSRQAYPQVRRALARSGLNEDLIAEVLERFGEEFAPWRESSFPGLLGNVVAGRLANRLNLGGANLVVDAACASSLAAVGQAMLELRSGRSDLVVAGGMDTFTDPFMFTCFCKTPALSPTEEARPFDQAADGTLLGEGLGVLILKRLSDARRDQDRIYAVIRGLGGSSDGRGSSIFAPSPQGQRRAMEAAYREAGFSPATVELVEGHGTGTQAGDGSELAALSELFGAHRPADRADSWCALGSIKSQIGHAKAAAGAAGLIKVILALYHKVLPPSIKASLPLPPLREKDSPLYLNVEARPWLAQGDHPRRGAVSSFGFGGSNFHCLLEESPTPKPLDEADCHLIALSSLEPASLAPRVAALALAQDAQELDRLARAEPFQATAPYRLALTGSFAELRASWPEVEKQLQASSASQAWPTVARWAGPNDQPQPTRLICGPPAFSANLGRELTLAFPAFQGVLDLASALSPWPLGQILFPPQLAANPRSCPQELTLSLGLVLSLAQGALWDSLGQPWEAVTGFGTGFLTAAFLAGCLTLEDAICLALAINDCPRELGEAKRAKPKPAKSTAGQSKRHASQNSLPASPKPRPDARARALLEKVFQFFQSLTWVEPRAPLFFEGQAITSLETFQAALSKILENPASPPPNWPTESGSEPKTTYLVIGSYPEGLPKSKALGLASGPWSVAALGQIAAELMKRGLQLDLSQWPRHSLPSLTPSPTPQSHLVYLTGSNLYRARRNQEIAAQPNTPADSQTLASSPNPATPAARASETLAGETLRELVDLQKQSLAALKELAQETRLARAAGSPLTVPLAPLAESDQTALSPTTSPNQANLARSSRTSTNLAPTGLAHPHLAPTAPESEPAVWPQLIEILAHETGYPADSLHRDMSLEEDLGLDSIKRVELLSALTERFPALSASQSPSQARTLGELAQLCQGQVSPPRSGGNQQLKAQAAGDGQNSPTQTSPVQASPDPGQTLIEVLAQETGYPAESLQLDMDLESDLGLDSIKRVEIFSTLSECLPSLDPAALSGATTIGELAKLLPQPAAPTSSSPAAGRGAQADSARPLAASEPDGPAVALAVVAQETGYPVELLTPDMSLEADLGLDSIKRVEILSALAEKLPRLSTTGQANLAAAETLGDWLALFGEESVLSRPQTDSTQTDPAQTSPSQPSLNQPSPNQPISPQTGPAGGNGQGKGNGRALLDQALAHRRERPSLFHVEPEFVPMETGPSPWPSQGLARLVGSDSLTQSLAKELRARGFEVERRSWRDDFEAWRERPADLLFLVWPGPDRGPQIITQALKALEICGPSLKAIVGLSFLGGAFGFPRPAEGVTQGNSISGALVGLLKCAAREWPGVSTRALDLPLAVYEMPHPNWIAAILENAAAPGPVELGLAAIDRPTQLTLKPYWPRESPEPLLSPGDTVVVTGGGRGVTAAVMKEMGRLFQPRLVILGRTPLGPPEPPWLAELTEDRDIKAALHQASGSQLTPRELGERARLILSTRELRRNLAELEATGAQVEYLPGDFTRPQVVETAARRVRSRFGPIRGFIHGAGVLADHPILGKSHEDFARVYATKTQIAAHLLEAFQPEPLKLVVFFSSSTARFGRQGQSDYAAGNEVLNKTAWELTSLHPQARVLAVNWGPWAAGMVSESLAGQFLGEGVGLIGLEEGVETFVRLIRSPVGDPAEVVVLGQGTNLAALTAYQRGPTQ